MPAVIESAITMKTTRRQTLMPALDATTRRSPHEELSKRPKRHVHHGRTAVVLVRVNEPAVIVVPVRLDHAVDDLHPARRRHRVRRDALHGARVEDVVLVHEGAHDPAAHLVDPAPGHVGVVVDRISGRAVPFEAVRIAGVRPDVSTVSYTHLTLPTSDLV